MSYFIKENLNNIIKGDSLEILRLFPDKSIDCIFADPPYFMQSTTRNGKEKKLMRADGTGEFKGCNDMWDKYEDYKEYDEFCYTWLKECKRILKDTGTIWVIGSFQNIYRIGYIMQNMGFWILNDVIWSKLNPTPNMAGTRFCNAHETLLWCSKGEKHKFTFNYKTMKYLNNNKQDKSVWNLGICQGNERLKDNNGEKVHTTQKPEALLTKVILSSTKPGDIILDPFFGTGTTGVIAKRYGRNYIGIERDDNNKYIPAAIKRINKIQDESNDITNLCLEKKPPKISTKELIEAGLLYENETFYNKNNNNVCKLLENGNVKSDIELSIHKMAAKLQNKSNANGWDYFYIMRDGKLVSINDLRYIAEKNKE
jgi:site-specific DNA-methyltransferase (adenine-specific)